jgi:hypothetical protein
MGAKLAVQIIRYVVHSCPGWVESEFVDADGRRHTFVEKVPLVTATDLGPESVFPQPGEIDCKILSRSQDTLGRTLVHVRTGIETAEEISEFTVISTQLSGSE